MDESLTAKFLSIAQASEIKPSAEELIAATRLTPIAYLYLTLAGASWISGVFVCPAASGHPTVRKLRQEDKSAGHIRLGPRAIQSDGAQKMETRP
jgi:hypothetical protein